MRKSGIVTFLLLFFYGCVILFSVIKMKEKTKKRKALSIFSKVLCALLVLILVVAGLNVMYYPRYRNSTAAFDIAAAEEQEAITVMSCNVRTWSPTDTAKKSWFYRADLVVNNIAAVAPDIIGFQEVTKVHEAYLSKARSGYNKVLAYRDNSPLSESCPVFYNTARFTALEQGSFWLSETPEVMSKDWHSAYYRICSYVILEEKATQKQLVVFNTHLDNVSDEARINGIRVVLDKIRAFGDLPSIIMGDFNSEEDTETYRAVTEWFNDAKYQTENRQVGATYQGFGKQLDRENIDYFMISKEGIAVNEYRVIDTVYDGAYPSDHFPIALKIELT